ncbi:hypothetical protein THAOC_07123 [Thalassiosira oceanica]|uniref:RING-type domain-containing protein n=1 Tax=Thalassiosira oceanica TaxID=159749 RepID=K0SYC5_THAOC|nr:hypothetical protein THAOC_07123 [Thalassiosira oceanica]|eukprot:EJK71438.1 hypothetical protein THAOC_07123 [Thalassiosira oceanica]
MSMAEEQHQPPAPAVPAAGPLPDAVTEEELMSSEHELPEGYTCPLCCLPMALPASMHSKFKSCCMRRFVMAGCILASVQRGLKDICPFCRMPTPDGDATLFALVLCPGPKTCGHGGPRSSKSLASAYYCDGDLGLQQDTSRAI